MPYKNIEDRRRVSRESMRRKRLGLHVVRLSRGENVNPAPYKREYVNPYPPIDFRLKNVQRLLDYLGITEEELDRGTTLACVEQTGRDILVWKPRTGEVLGLIPENNARGLNTVWKWIARHDAEHALQDAQHQLSWYDRPYSPGEADVIDAPSQEEQEALELGG